LAEALVVVVVGVEEAEILGFWQKEGQSVDNPSGRPVSLSLLITAVSKL